MNFAARQRDKGKAGKDLLPSLCYQPLTHTLAHIQTLDSQSASFLLDMVNYQSGRLQGIGFHGKTGSKMRGGAA